MRTQTFLRKLSQYKILRNKKFKFTALGTLGIASLLILSGCGGNAVGSGTAAVEPPSGYPSSYPGRYEMPKIDGIYNNPQPRSNIKDGGTLVLDSTYVPNLNYLSVTGNSVYVAALWRWYMPKLTLYDAAGNVSFNPDYLTSVETVSQNPLVIAYNINPKAHWNNGEPITWKSFWATWSTQNGENPEYNPTDTEGYDSIASVKQGNSPLQAIVTFKKPWYPWQSLFGTIINPSLANPTTFKKGWVENPHSNLAAGPFIVESYNKNGAVLVRNPKWWAEPAKLDKIVYKFMDATAAINAFQNGELNALSFTSAPALKAARSMRDVQIRFGYSSVVRVIVYNGKVSYLKDLLVRKALTQGFRRDVMTKIAFQGTGWNPTVTPGSELFPIYQEGYENNMPPDSGYNPQLAKENLEKAGFKMGPTGYFEKDGKVLELKYTYFGNSATNAALARAYQVMMKDIGVKIELDNRPVSKWASSIDSGEYEIMPLGWSSSSPFSQVNVGQLYGMNSPSNYSFVGDAEVDRLAKIPGTIPNQLEAVKAANRAEKAALALYGTFPIMFPPSFVAVTSGLANFGPAGFLTVLPQDVGWQK